MEDALDGTKAHTLINVFADESCIYIPAYFLPLFATCNLHITGTAIRYPQLAATGRFRRKVTKQEFYGMLLAKFIKSRKSTAEFRDKQHPDLRNELESYILSSKGKQVGFQRGFELKKGLDPHEEEVIRWYLEKYTNYKVRVTGMQ